MAQTKDYSDKWKKVEALEKKGLTKSALKEVMIIYNLALKDKNDAQQIKACIYQINYRNLIDEDSYENNIFFVDTLIAKAKVPAKNILQSMQAEMFWQFTRNHAWQLYNRTKLEEEKSHDINTWSLDKLYATISKLYLSSIKNSELLKNTKLDELNPVIIKGENSRHLRPTLFDFLSHRALEYFVSGEGYLTRPTYKFEINDVKAFAPVNEFINASFYTEDTLSLHHKAMLLFQEILRFHINDKNPDALLDADMIRLSFVNQYSVSENKANLYETALKNIGNTYSSNPISAQANYLIAQSYYDKAIRNSTKMDNPNGIKIAKEICEQVISKFPKSEGGINCRNLLNGILEPSLSMEAEKVNVPDQHFRTLIKYKNVKNIYFRIVKTNRDEIEKFSDIRYDEKAGKEISSLKYIKNWSEILPDPGDYMDHAVEVKVDKLPVGTYFVLASLDENFTTKKNIIVMQVVQVSNISYINNNENQYYVLNRDNGQPLSGAEVQVWERKYNYAKSKYEEVKGDKLTADKNGSFIFKKGEDYWNYTFQIKYMKDELFQEETQYNYAYNDYENTAKPITLLFTDRSIYRPGQTVYFKGIVLQSDNEASRTKILPSRSSTVQLFDANYQKSGELVLLTNEYGSYNGAFKLPVTGLTGQFRLEDITTGSSQYISVEEYKRPKFSVEMQRPSGTYKVNDSITVTGTSKAYAGNKVDGAKVTYRVVRKVRYPVWWGYGGYVRSGMGKFASLPYGRNEEVEITSGESITDANGEFTVKFKALPDNSIDKKDQPTFYYEVTADVTDLNGETRSAETSVAVAYQALKLEINVADKLNADSLKNIQISSTNTNDIFEKAFVNLTIHKVESPNRFFRNRFWQLPDQFLMSKEQYYAAFPYDVYKDEDQQNTWPVTDRVLDISDSTSDDSKFNLRNSKLAAGWYKIIVTTKDKYGEDVRAEKYILLFDNKDAVNEAIAVKVIKGKAEPGEQISYTISTVFDNVWLIHTMSTPGQKLGTTYDKISNYSPSKYSFPVYEDYRGGVSMSYAFVQHNRPYTGFETFAVPWSNKDLKISYSTFRDKLLPGAKDRWTVKISGSKGEKVSSEILAAMYDASLDQFRPHGWSALNVWPSFHNEIRWSSPGFTSFGGWLYDWHESVYLNPLPKSYDRLIYFNDPYRNRLFKSIEGKTALEGKVAGVYMSPSTAWGVTNSVTSEANDVAVADSVVTVGNDDSPKHMKLPKPAMDDADGDGVADQLDKEPNTPRGLKVDANGVRVSSDNVQVRKNFNETAFFFPDLKTDAEGNVSFEFTVPEALTQWKLMTLAHTKELASGYTEKTIVTQKPLMVQPNAPRFMREGDKMEFSAKIVNMLDTFFAGTATLELFDAVTNEPVNKLFKNIAFTQSFLTWPKQSALVKFPIEIPLNFGRPLLYRIKAEAQVPNYQNGDTFSDGEEMALPVLTNRTLVTESMPINLRNTTKKDFKFEKLLKSGESKTLKNNSLTVEYTSNPAWYAIQALPYLMEYPYECAEQTFNRFYANALATHITKSMPAIKAVFEKWKDVDTAALMSNLQKNEELKSALLQETPWVMEAQNEAQQKKNIALLFDMVKMGAETDKAIAKLKEMQSSNGGFVWFKGGPDDRYITQYIVTGIGHLKKLGVQNQNVQSILDAAIPYLDKKTKEDYDYLIKHKVKLNQNNLNATSIQYLYMRSFFPEYAVGTVSKSAYNYWLGQIKKYWLNNPKYLQAMIALTLHRTKDIVTPKAIIKSLKENAINKDELGMYWKEWTTGGYWWHEAPIESQAMMIEAFTDIDKNTATVDDLKTWLLKQKQTQNWKTTKATAEACYALLLGGSNWLVEERETVIKLGTTNINSDEDPTESGTGYFKKRIEGDKVKPEMGNIEVTIQNPPVDTFPKGHVYGPSWGSVYWQYFEDLDKITSAETPLKLVKKLFVEKNTDRGPQLIAVNDGDKLKVGDKIKVRIELKVDRDMEYIHMKDMRAACMEPVNVLSEYKWQGGLGYYESTKDASTNFFFNYLNRGTYVFEYPMFVTHAGNFSNGITTIQCMYAPEFTSHSEGVRVTVDQ
ncbi:alpha-2-macroglobulin family protein [Ferruginibacter sp. SUN002]|uniref:alpha-2-macroglobulin family protein n=1 Tax=Ferruginibacter sp. SUN002 TaxID=2937789 RepID=UPI003D36B392